MGDIMRSRIYPRRFFLLLVQHSWLSRATSVQLKTSTLGCHCFERRLVRGSGRITRTPRLHFADSSSRSRTGLGSWNTAHVLRTHKATATKSIELDKAIATKSPNTADCVIPRPLRTQIIQVQSHCHLQHFQLSFLATVDFHSCCIPSSFSPFQQRVALAGLDRQCVAVPPPCGYWTFHRCSHPS